MPSSRTLLMSSLLLASCATIPPEEVALREIAWDVATRCAAGKNLLVDRVDSTMRVWTMLPQGGQQDLPAFNKCYVEGTRAELAKRPDLQAWRRAHQNQ